MNNAEIWLTRQQAAKWLSVCPDTITNIAKEMEEKDLPGIWRETRGFLRINKADMSAYLRNRRKLK